MFDMTCGLHSPSTLEMESQVECIAFSATVFHCML